MSKYILYIFFIVVGVVFVYLSILKELGYIILGFFVIDIIKTALENHSDLLLWLKCKTFYVNKDIRISASYLFRIKIDGKYLLIRGARIKSQFQPVGGVYKRLPEAVDIFNQLKIRDDDCIPIDQSSKDDLRLRMSGKNIPTFISWYKSGKQRENSVFREFYEELIRTEILCREVFPYINYRFVCRKQTDISYVDYFSCYEILIADIYELIPDEKQKEELIRLMNCENTGFIWAEEKMIRSKGVSPNDLDQKISETSKWIL